MDRLREVVSGIWASDQPTKRDYLEVIPSMGITTIFDLTSKRDQAHDLRSPYYDSGLNNDIDLKKVPYIIIYMPMIIGQSFPKDVATIVDAIMKTYGPVLFHCLKGRDRTGIIEAIIKVRRGQSATKAIDEYEQNRSLNIPAYNTLLRTMLKGTADGHAT